MYGSFLRKVNSVVDSAEGMNHSPHNSWQWHVQCDKGMCFIILPIHSPFHMSFSYVISFFICHFIFHLICHSIPFHFSPFSTVLVSNCIHVLHTSSHPFQYA
eukprot:749942_1